MENYLAKYQSYMKENYLYKKEIDLINKEIKESEGLLNSIYLNWLKGNSNVHARSSLYLDIIIFM